MMGLLAFALVIGKHQDAVARSPIKPDVHLTIEINDDGSNTVYLEVFIHPLVSPLLQQGVNALYEELVSSNGNRIETMETKRDGKSYNTVAIHFESLDELNDFMEKSQFFSDFVNALIPNLTIPAFFSEFQIIKNETEKERTIRVQIRMEPEITKLFTFMNLSMHLRLPFKIKDHNADEKDGKELTWGVKPGHALIVSATAVSSKNKIVSGFGEFGEMIAGKKLYLGIAMVLLFFFGVVFYIVRLRYGRAGNYEDDIWNNW